MLSAESYLLDTGLLLEVRSKVVLELYCKIECYFFGSRSIFFSSSSQLSEIALAEGIEFIVFGQDHCMVISTSNLDNLLALEELYEFGMR